MHMVWHSCTTSRQSKNQRDPMGRGWMKEEMVRLGTGERKVTSTKTGGGSEGQTGELGYPELKDTDNGREDIHCVP